MYKIYLFPLLFLFSFFTACGTNNDSVAPDTTYTNVTFHSDVCDQIIDKHYYEVCYSYQNKGALFVAYTLDGTLVNDPNIDERLSFYEETQIPLEYRSDSDDYTGSGYDRGHMASDASFDYNEAALYSVYSMANIVPQNPDVNRYSWIDTEYLEREKAESFGRVSVVIAIIYGDNPRRIGENDIAVPNGFYKKLYNNDKGYEACYYYENIPYDTSSDTIEEHMVSCNYFPFY